MTRIADQKHAFGQVQFATGYHAGPEQPPSTDHCHHPGGFYTDSGKRVRFNLHHTHQKLSSKERT